MPNDYRIATFIGFITGLLILVPLWRVGIYGPLLLAPPLVVPLVWVAALRLSLFLGRYAPASEQFVKFVIVGFLYAAIDFSSLNILSHTTNITGGFLVGGVNAPGFILGVTGSYFLHKWWVFDSSGRFTERFPLLVIVALAAIFINSAIVIFITTYVPVPQDWSAGIWLNVAKVIATSVTVFFNFAAFKHWVFRN